MLSLTFLFFDPKLVIAAAQPALLYLVSFFLMVAIIDYSQLY